MANENIIFIAHANEDKPRVKKLCERLEIHGLNIWFDEKSLEIGSRWEYEIKRAIKASQFFIACFSSNSVSKKGFIQKELRLALSELELFPQNKTFFLPVLLDNIDIPELNVGTIALSDYQFYRIYDDKEERRLIYFLLKSISNQNNSDYIKEIAENEYNLDYFLFFKVQDVLMREFDKVTDTHHFQVGKEGDIQKLFDGTHQIFNSFDADIDQLRFTMITSSMVSLEIVIRYNIIICFAGAPYPFNKKEMNKLRKFVTEANSSLFFGAFVIEEELVGEEPRLKVLYRHSITGSSATDHEIMHLVAISYKSFSDYGDDLTKLWDPHFKPKNA